MQISSKPTGDAASIGSIEMIIIFAVVAIVLFLVWKWVQHARGRGGARGAERSG